MLLAAAAAAAAGSRLRRRLDPFDCYVDKGEDYIGLMTMASSGRTCMNWLKQGKYGATVKGIGNHNFCRNPKGSKDKPWCFVKDPEKDWEYCEVKLCKANGAPPEPWKSPKGTKS